MKQYTYVGDSEILKRVKPSYKGFPIKTIEDILKWIKETKQITHHGFLTATFIINLNGELLLADRHSEHVQCAFGAPVLSAGEITFFIKKNELEVTEISNQSTGYCPHLDTWIYVQPALEMLKLEHPGKFTNAFTFGLCEKCLKYAIVKEGYEECSTCGSLYKFYK